MLISCAGADGWFVRRQHTKTYTHARNEAVNKQRFGAILTRAQARFTLYTHNNFVARKLEIPPPYRFSLQLEIMRERTRARVLASRRTNRTHS